MYSEKDKLNIFDLEEGHKNLLAKYLSFFKSKQEKFVKEIKFEIEEYQEDNIKEMMFSKKEVIDILEVIKEKITFQMDKEISYYLNMNAIFIQLLLHNADKNKVTLSVEISQVQNLENVNEMNEFVKSLITPNLPEFGKSNNISKLNSISKTQNLINDFEQLKHDYEIIKQNFNIIKNQNDMLIQENKNIQNNSACNSEEIKSLRDQIMKLSINKNKQEDIDNFNKLQFDLESTRIKLDEQVLKYQNLLKDFDIKVNESIQFKQLKKFLQEKNTLIIELKDQLAKKEDK